MSEEESDLSEVQPGRTPTGSEGATTYSRGQIPAGLFSPASSLLDQIKEEDSTSTGDSVSTSDTGASEETKVTSNSTGGQEQDTSNTMSTNMYFKMNPWSADIEKSQIVGPRSE